MFSVYVQCLQGKYFNSAGQEDYLINIFLLVFRGEYQVHHPDCAKVDVKLFMVDVMEVRLRFSSDVGSWKPSHYNNSIIGR